MTDHESTTATAMTAGFGAALAGLGAAIPAEAAVVNIDITVLDPLRSEFTAPIMGTDGANLGSAVIYNGASFGSRGVYAFGAPGGTTYVDYVSLINTGATISPGTVVPGSVVRDGRAAFGVPSFTGTAHFAFQEGANVGWFSVRFAGTIGNSTFTFLEGAYDDAGQSIAHGATAAAVPLPATLPLAALGVLALGAAGLRRKRAKAA